MKTRFFKAMAVLFVLLACTALTKVLDDMHYSTLKLEDSDTGNIKFQSNCVTTLTDGGAGTETLTGVIPADVVSLGITCRVDTVIVGSGASTFSLGDGTDADLYGTGLAFAAGTTVDDADYTASPATQAWSTSAGDLTMTADAGQFDSGAITCCSHYYAMTAPTS